MGGGSGEPFKPMNAKLDPEAADRRLTEEEKTHPNACVLRMSSSRKMSQTQT